MIKILSHSSWSSSLLLYSLILLQIRPILATLTYCSNENTGSNLVNSSIYQSNGLCHDKCNNQGYALAIVQYQDCWCSDYVPGDTVDVDDCNMDCPGFPTDKCGGEGLYGYIYLNQPSGTVDGSSSATTSSSSTTSSSTSTSTTPSSSWTAQTTTSSSTSSSTTSTSTTPTTSSTSTTSSSTSTTSSSTITSSISSSTSTTSSSTSTSTSSTSSSSIIPIQTTSSTSSSKSSKSTSSSSTKPTSTPIITSVIYSISTVTGGQETQYITTGIQTTFTPSSVSSSDSLARATGVNPTNSNTDAENHDGFFDNKGKVAGVFTAVGVVGVVILALLIWLLSRCLRDRKDGRDYDDEDVVGVEGYASHGSGGSGGYAYGSGKRTSYPVVTKTNILNDDEFGENSSTDDTVINEKQHSNANSFKQKSSGNNGAGANGNSGNNGNHKRNLSIISTDFGTPIIDNHGDSTYVDQRLDVGTFSNIHERDEVLSLNDNEDYSRKVLRVTNP